MRINIDGEQMEFRIDHVMVQGHDVIIEGLHTSGTRTVGGVHRVVRGTITMTVDELTDVIDPVLDHSLRLFFKADPPDANCVTTADGGCIGGLSAGMAPCLHDPR